MSIGSDLLPDDPLARRLRRAARTLDATLDAGAAARGAGRTADRDAAAGSSGLAAVVCLHPRPTAAPAPARAARPGPRRLAVAGVASAMLLAAGILTAPSTSIAAASPVVGRTADTMTPPVTTATSSERPAGHRLASTATVEVPTPAGTASDPSGPPPPTTRP